VHGDIAERVLAWSGVAKLLDQKLPDSHINFCNAHASILSTTHSRLFAMPKHEPQDTKVETMSEKYDTLGPVSTDEVDAVRRMSAARRSSIVPGHGRKMSEGGRRVSVADAVFGEITEEGPNYRDVRVLQENTCCELTYPRWDGSEQWPS